MRADASRSTCSAVHAQRLGAEDGLLIARSPHHRRRVLPATGANIPLGLYQHDFSLHPEHRDSASVGTQMGRPCRLLRRAGVGLARWKGERVYESTEDDLRLTATHDGHVWLHIELWHERDASDGAERRGWTVETWLRLDPGEELSHASRGIRAVVGVDS